jgi:hypothetical protein
MYPQLLRLNDFCYSYTFDWHYNNII